MKLQKYTFRTPLSGSIYCEEVFVDGDGCKELDPEQMARLYDDYSSLATFLERNREDLTWAVPDELADVIIKAEFGDHGIYAEQLYLLTHIWTRTTPDEEDAMVAIQEWILGQLSDGWGEGLEQREWREEQVEICEPYFDDDTLDFDTEQSTCFASYYVNPWRSEDFEIGIWEQTEEEVTVEPQEIARLELNGRIKRVYRLPDRASLRNYMLWGDCNCTELSLILNIATAADLPHYLVEEDTENGVQLLPKFVVQTGPYAGMVHFADASQSTHEPIELYTAIIALLK